MDQDQPLALPVLADVSDPPPRQRLVHVAELTGWPPTRSSPPVTLPSAPSMVAGQLAAPGADQPVKTEDLAAGAAERSRPDARGRPSPAASSATVSRIGPRSAMPRRPLLAADHQRH